MMKSYPIRNNKIKPIKREYFYFVAYYIPISCLIYKNKIVSFELIHTEGDYIIVSGNYRTQSNGTTIHETATTYGEISGGLIT